MSHEVETHTNADGTVIAAAAFARQSAWHKLGTVTEELMTGDDLLRTAHLGGWDVRKAPSFAAVPYIDADGVGTHMVEVPGRFTLVRWNPFTGQPDAFPSSVSAGYRPIQNEELISLGDAIVEVGSGSAHWDTGGSLRGGTEVFATITLDECEITVGGEDPIKLNLALLNNHRGTGAQVSLITPVRVVCANTQSAALANFQARHTIWHTDSAQGKIEQARAELGLAAKYAGALQEEFDAMIEAPITDAWFIEHVARSLYPAPTGVGVAKRAVTAHAAREDALLDLFHNSPTLVTPTGRSIKGTRYGAYQVVTEYMDFYSSVPSTTIDAQLTRATRVVTGKTDAMKEAAFRLLAVR